MFKYSLREPAIKRSKESDEDNEEVIVDVRNPDSCSEHESEHAPTNSDINHENSGQKTPSDESKEEDLIVYVKGKRKVIYSCHICDCFFLKEVGFQLKKYLYSCLVCTFHTHGSTYGYSSKHPKSSAAGKANIRCTCRWVSLKVISKKNVHSLYLLLL